MNSHWEYSLCPRNTRNGFSEDSVRTPMMGRPAISAGPPAPPPPPKRLTPPRIQFSTKLPPALVADVKAFSDHHDAEIQIVVELALKEYLTSRGWEISS